MRVLVVRMVRVAGGRTKLQVCAPSRALRQLGAATSAGGEGGRQSAHLLDAVPDGRQLVAEMLTASLSRVETAKARARVSARVEHGVQAALACSLSMVMPTASVQARRQRMWCKPRVRRADALLPRRTTRSRWRRRSEVCMRDTPS